MSDSERNPNWQPKGFIVPLSREEWERELDHNVELGLAEPGETYEQYIGKLGRDFIVCLHHTKVR